MGRSERLEIEEFQRPLSHLRSIIAGNQDQLAKNFFPEKHMTNRASAELKLSTPLESPALPAFRHNHFRPRVPHRMDIHRHRDIH